LSNLSDFLSAACADCLVLLHTCGTVIPSVGCRLSRSVSVSEPPLEPYDGSCAAEVVQQRLCATEVVHTRKQLVQPPSLACVVLSVAMVLLWCSLLAELQRCVAWCERRRSCCSCAWYRACLQPVLPCVSPRSGSVASHTSECGLCCLKLWVLVRTWCLTVMGGSAAAPSWEPAQVCSTAAGRSDADSRVYAPYPLVTQSAPVFWS
jgi:hypothetical protein